MTTASIPDTSSSAVGTTRVRRVKPGRPLLRTTVRSGIAAAVAVSAFAAVSHGAGVSFRVGGERIPVAGFAQMTLFGAMLGGVLAAVLDGRSTRARHRFLQVTILLAAVSCVPSVALPDDTASKLALIATHLIAAAIVVPALYRKIAR